MKQKSVRYILVAGVIVVWGLIIYRIIGAFNNNDIPVMTPATMAVKDNDIRNDSFSLYINYPDPFIPEIDSSAVLKDPTVNHLSAPIVSSNPYQTVEQPLAVVSPDFIKYYGMIANSKTKLKVALMSIHNTEMVLKEKEHAGDVVLLRIQHDKVQILYNHKLYFIAKFN